MKILYSELFLAQICDESIKIEEEYGAYGDHFQDIIFQKVDDIANEEASESDYTFKTDNPERDQSLNQLNWFTAQTPKFQKILKYLSLYFNYNNSLIFVSQLFIFQFWYFAFLFSIFIFVDFRSNFKGQGINSTFAQWAAWIFIFVLLDAIVNIGLKTMLMKNVLLVAG